MRLSSTSIDVAVRPFVATEDRSARSTHSVRPRFGVLIVTTVECIFLYSVCASSKSTLRDSPTSNSDDMLTAQNSGSSRRLKAYYLNPIIRHRNKQLSSIPSLCSTVCLLVHDSISVDRLGLRRVQTRGALIQHILEQNVAVCAPWRDPASWNASRSTDSRTGSESWAAHGPADAGTSWRWTEWTSRPNRSNGWWYAARCIGSYAKWT